MGQHVEHLDRCVQRGIWLKYYDPDAERHPLPTYPFHGAPKNLVTRRQLRDAGLAPGHKPVAQLRWRHNGPGRRVNGERWAWLFDKSLAVAKRVATSAQLEAASKALAARKTCPTCQQEQPYCIPKSLGECLPCADRARSIEREPEREFTGDPNLSWFDSQQQTTQQQDIQSASRMPEPEGEQVKEPFRVATDGSDPRAAAAHDATQTISYHAEQGVPLDVIGQRLHDVATQHLNEARTAEGRAYATEYGNTIDTLMRDLREPVRTGCPEEGCSRTQEPCQGCQERETALLKRGQQRQPQMEAS
jgi:hypothetical protein